MKFNWGKGIVLAITLFIGFIMYFVVTMMSDKKYDHDLVTEKYYEQELSYQERIDAARNAKDLGENIKVERIADGLMIYFPKAFEKENLEGKLFLYRPSDKRLDFEVPFSKIQNYLLVPDKSLLDGRWNISLELTYRREAYLFTEQILY